MEIYAEASFVRTLAYLSEDKAQAVQECLSKLKNRQWDNGLRVKRLRGFRKRVWEARLNSGDRLLFVYSKAFTATANDTTVVVLDIASHDRVSYVRRRNLTPVGTVGMVVENFQDPALIEEDITIEPGQNYQILTEQEFFEPSPLADCFRQYASQFVYTEAFPADPDQPNLWLTEEQMAVVLTRGHCVVTGTAGSGKTTMAVQRLLTTYKDNKKSLYLAFNPCLVEYARKLFHSSLPPERRNDATLLTNCEFQSFDEFVSRYLVGEADLFRRDREVRYPEFKAAYERWGAPVPPQTAWSEIRSILKGGCLNPKIEMLDLKRYLELGKNRAPDLQQERIAFYAFATRYQTWLKKKGGFDEIDLCRAVLRHLLLTPAPTYSTIICDEVQDLTELQMDLVFRTFDGSGSVFFTGDLNQIINPSGFRWEELRSVAAGHKINLPEAKHLSVNFRSVGNIARLSRAFLTFRRRLLGKSPHLSQEQFLQDGLKPKVILKYGTILSSYFSEMDARTAVLVRSEKERDRLRLETGSPFIFTIEEAKGLEFDTVFVWDFFSEQSKLWQKALSGSLPKQMAPALRHEFNLLFVATTRPRRLLNFYDPRPLIWSEQEIMGHFEESLAEVIVADTGFRALTETQWSEHGEYYLSQGFPTQALVCFERGHDGPGVARTRAALFEEQGEWREAAELYITEGNHLRAAEMLERSHDWDIAADQFDLAGRDLDAARCRAHFAESMGDWKGALEYWQGLGDVERALLCAKRSGDTMILSVLEAQRMVALRRYDAAAKVYEVLGDWSTAGEQWQQGSHWAAAAAAFYRANDFEAARHAALKVTDAGYRVGMELQILLKEGDLVRAIAFVHEEKAYQQGVAIFREFGFSEQARPFEAALAEAAGSLKEAQNIWRQLGDTDAMERVREQIDASADDRFERALRLGQAGQSGHTVAELREMLELSPTHKLGRLELGALLAHQNSHNAAIKEFRKVIELDSSFADAHYNLANSLMQLNRAEEALDELNEAARLNPEDYSTQLNIGSCLAELEDYEAAIPVIRKAIRLDPEQAMSHFNLGQILAVLGRFEEARVAWKEALRLDPAYAEAHESLGMAYNERGDYVTAFAEYQKAFQLDPSMPDLKQRLDRARFDRDNAVRLNRVASITPNMPAVSRAKLETVFADGSAKYIQAGDDFYANKQWESAIESYYSVVNINPNLARVHCRTGMALVESGRFTEAVIALENALQLDPSIADAHAHLGMILRNEGRTEEAITSFRMALQLNPHAGYVWSNLGLALRARGSLEEAIQAYETAIQHSPESSVTYYSLGNALDEAKQWDRAVVAYEKALSLNPDFEFAAENLQLTLLLKNQAERASLTGFDFDEIQAQLNAAKEAIKAKNWSKAILLLEDTIKIDPDFIKAHNSLAEAYLSQGRLEECAAQYIECVRLDPRDEKLQYNLGFTYSKLGEMTAAIKHFQKALNLQPTFALARKEMATALAQIGQTDEAVAAFLQAIQDDPRLVSAYLNLGVCYANAGRMQRANEVWNQALRIEPDNRDAQKFLGQLRRY